MKPLDEDAASARSPPRARRVVTVEEGALARRLRLGVLEAFERARARSAGCAVRGSASPTRSSRTATRRSSARELGLDAAGIARGGARAGRRAARRVARPRGSARSKQRIDLLLVARGLAESRAKAQALVMAGAVVAGEQRVDKPGQLVPEDAPLRVKEDAAPQRYVSRGALKLERALDAFAVDPARAGPAPTSAPRPAASPTSSCSAAPRRSTPWTSATGSSTPRLRGDPRVVVRERENARHLDAAALGERGRPRRRRPLLHLAPAGPARA